MCQTTQLFKSRCQRLRTVRFLLFTLPLPSFEILHPGAVVFDMLCHAAPTGPPVSRTPAAESLLMERRTSPTSPTYLPKPCERDIPPTAVATVVRSVNRLDVSYTSLQPLLKAQAQNPPAKKRVKIARRPIAIPFCTDASRFHVSTSVISSSLPPHQIV